jgi:hypothetical protein
MTTRKELKAARRSLARGRTDEALVYLWNAVEPARLEGGRALSELRRLATLIAARGEEGHRREAQRLLEALGVSSEEIKQIEVGVLDEPAAEGEAQAEEEAKPGSRAGRLLIPLFFLMLILLNVIARLFDGD